MERSCLSCNKPTKYKPPAFSGKYCSNKCQQAYEWLTVTKPKLLQGAVHYNSPAMIRYLTERDGYKCSCCSLVEWQDKPISLDVDHVDGDKKNNLPDNLRFLCPNCHRQTPTWGNKKRLLTWFIGRIAP